MIEGSGTNTLDDFPDMFVGDMTIAGHIGPGECRSSSRAALEYPNPGKALTISEVQNIPFKKPTDGKCYSKATVSNSTVTTMPTTTVTSAMPLTSITSVEQTTVTDSKCENPPPQVISVVVNDSMYPCTCLCQKKP